MYIYIDIVSQGFQSVNASQLSHSIDFVGVVVFPGIPHSSLVFYAPAFLYLPLLSVTWLCHKFLSSFADSLGLVVHYNRSLE
jgi:hypothetical protein